SRKDLKPSSSRLLRRMLPSPPPHHHPCEAYPKVPSEGQEHPPTYRMSRDRYPSPLRRGRSVKAALRCRARAGVTEETLESHLQAPAAFSRYRRRAFLASEKGHGHRPHRRRLSAIRKLRKKIRGP